MSVEKSNNEDKAREHETEPSLPDYINNYLLLFYAFTCFIIYFSLASILYLNDQVLLSIIVPGPAAFVLPLYFLARRFGASFKREFSITAAEPSKAVLAVLIAAGCIVPVDAISGFLERYRPVDADYINLLLAIKPKGIAGFLSLAAGLVLAGPFSEEIIFRGFIQRIFQRNMPLYPAVILAALIFSLSHFDVTLMPGTTMIGIIFGYLYFRGGSLLYPFISHASFNFVSLLRLHFTPVEALKSGEVSDPSAVLIAGSVILLASSLYFFEKIAMTKS